jgi:hypothetical protein
MSEQRMREGMNKGCLLFSMISSASVNILEDTCFSGGDCQNGIARE